MDIRQDNDTFASLFGLRHNPFSAIGSFPFFRVRRREVLEQLVHFSRYSELILAVTGPRGSGKTVLRHAVAAVSKETALNVVVSGLKSSDAAGIAQQLGYALQCTNADIMSLLHAVEQSVLAGKDVQLLVDNAETLDASGLALLQRLGAGNGQARCKIFLFGEPSLQTLLQDQKAQDAGFEYHLVELEPWQEEEVEAYLQQRLQAAGGDLDLFSDDELAILLEQGQGWPGVINQLAQELLLERVPESEEAQPAAARGTGRVLMPRRHLVALLLVAFLFILAWYLLGDSKSGQQQEGRAEVATAVPEQKQPTAQKRIVLDLPTSEPAAPVEPKQVQQAPVTPVKTQEAVAPQPAVTREPAVSASAPKAEPKGPEPVVQAAPAARPVVKPEPAKTPAKPVEPAKPRVAATGAERRAASTGSWYAAQPAQSYTLQLFATSSEQNARSFVQANGSQFHYFRKMHQGQQLFVVTHGRFDNAEAARAVAERLPESLRRNKPWPRTFASIRQEMR